MKKYSILFLLLSIIIFGCGIAKRSLSESNRSKLVDISVGMTKNEVKNVMGTEGDGGASQPYKAETFLNNDNIPIDLWYYLTDSWRGQDEEEQLTPIVFESGKVVGSGWKFLEGNKEKYELKIKMR